MEYSRTYRNGTVATIEGCGGGAWSGYCVVWFRPADEYVAYWYADTYAACVQRANGRHPSKSIFHESREGHYSSLAE